MIDYRITTLSDVAQAIHKDKPLMYDCETIGLYGKIRLAQFYQEHWACALLVEHPNPMELVSLLTDIVVVGHNIHYDISSIQENLGKLSWMPKEFHCTFLLSRLHFYTKEEFSLDKVINYAIGFNPYEGKDLQKSDWSLPVLSSEQLNYAAMDVVYLCQVYNVVKPSIDDYSYKLDMLMTRYCLDFQNNGMPLDLEKLNAKYAANMYKIKEIGLKINCNSYQQVRPYIGSALSDDEGLARLSYEGNERAKEVRETRKLTKNNSFLTSYLKNSVDGVLYGKFKVSARSGRTTSSDENLQQIPRNLKEIFGVASDKEVIIFSDFSQCQLRAVCAVTGDTAMETLFRAGKDLHDYVAEMTFGIGFTPDQRTIAKTENFGLLFGAGVTVFGKILIKAAGMWLSETELHVLKKRWLGLWKQVAEWQTKGIKDWKKGIIWCTPLGRRYTATMMTDQLNIQIQGYEAEVAKLAMHYMYNDMKVLGYKLRNFVHDCFLFTGPNDEVKYKQACVIMANAMQEAWKEMSKCVKVTDLPMPVKVRVGYNWGDIDKNNIFIYEYKQ